LNRESPSTAPAPALGLGARPIEETVMKKLYRVHNPTTCHEFGLYEGETAEDALDAMARDAGYENYLDACETADGCAVADEIADEE
jgi:hypothetical protein